MAGLLGLEGAGARPQLPVRWWFATLSLGPPATARSDFIFFARTAAEAAQLRDRVLADMNRLGWCVNMTKSQLQPAQRVTYLGLELCSMPSPFLQVPADKIRRCRDQIRYMLRRRTELNPSVAFEGRTVARLAGSEYQPGWRREAQRLSRIWGAVSCLQLLTSRRRLPKCQFGSP